MEKEFNEIESAVIFDRIMNIITKFINANDDFSINNLEKTGLVIIAQDGSVLIDVKNDDDTMKFKMEPRYKSYLTPDGRIPLDLREGDYEGFEIFEGIYFE